MTYKSFKGPTVTPWGSAQSRQELAPGVVAISTARHGGVWISKQRQQQMPPALTKVAVPTRPAFYEEDIAYAAVLLAFPDALHAWAEQMNMETDEAAYILRNKFRDWYPDVYEEWTGKAVPPGTSWVRDKANFENEHADDYVVIAAWGDWHHECPKGMVLTLARRGSDCDQRRFLVPAEEYNEASPFGFVIDREKHEEFHEADCPQS